LKKRSDPNFTKFLSHMQHTPHAEIEARLKQALADGEISMKDQHGRLIPADELDMDTFRVKFPDDLTADDSQLEMTVAAKDGRQVGIGVDLSEDQLNTLAQDNAMSVEETLAEVQKLPPDQQTNLIIELIANALVDGNEAEFERAISKDKHDPRLWGLLREKALALLVSQGRAPKRPLGPPGMRGFLWIAEVPEGPRLCPRCGETWIPIDEAPGEYPGAMSRVRVGRGRPATAETAEYASRSIEICSPCGQDEAMGRGVIQIEEWPIGKGEYYYDNRFFTDAMGDAIKSGRVRLQNEATGEIIPSDGSDVQLLGIDGDEVRLQIGIGDDAVPVRGLLSGPDGKPFEGSYEE
jgi:hypothetical protein